jgi:hypothetical protein
MGLGKIIFDNDNASVFAGQLQIGPVTGKVGPQKPWRVAKNQRTLHISVDMQGIIRSAVGGRFEQPVLADLVIGSGKVPDLGNQVSIHTVTNFRGLVLTCGMCIRATYKPLSLRGNESFVEINGMILMTGVPMCTGIAFTPHRVNT